MDYKEIKLKDQGLSISNNELSMTIDIEEVINQFTADEIVDNFYNREEIYKIIEKRYTRYLEKSLKNKKYEHDIWSKNT